MSLPFMYETYNRGRKILEPNGEKYIIEEIFQCYLNGMNLFDVAIEMNQRGYKTKDKNIFTHKTIRDTLTNEKYIGTQIYGKRKWFKDENGKKVSKPAPESEWIIYHNAHEPIISSESFEKVANKLKDNRIVDVNSRKRTYGLTNIIKCGYCGRNITFYKDSNNGKTYMKPCAKIDFITGKRCPNSATSLQLVDDFIYHHIWKIVRPAMDYVNTIAAKNTKIVNTNTARIKDLTGEMKDINKKLDNLLEMMLVRGGTDSRLIEKENQLKYRLSQIEQELSSLEHDSSGKDWWDVFCELQRDLFAVPFKWKSPDPSIRNACLKKYVDKVVYTKNDVDPSNPHFEIHYTESVKQAIELYEQDRKEMKIRVEGRKQKDIVEGT